MGLSAYKNFKNTFPSKEPGLKGKGCENMPYAVEVVVVMEGYTMDSPAAEQY